MKVFIACEFSGIVREEFIKRGHDAWSCDLLPTEIPGNHIQGDALKYLNDGWDLMIAHPPCTHLAVSGAAWFKYKQKEQAEALEFVRKLLEPTNIVSKGERKVYASGKSSPMWHAKTGGGCGKKRSITFQGIADAMAKQWG